MVSREQTVVRRPPEAGGVGFVNPEVVWGVVRHRVQVMESLAHDRLS